MFRRAGVQWAKRSAGYVFWRQNNLIELDKSRRSYLSNERPVPVAEIASRMRRVVARYEAVADARERTLLRGEYKYFSGKLCDMRAARADDLIQFLRCGAFFGFFDAAQVDRALYELELRREALEAAELATLLGALPGLHKASSPSFAVFAEALAPLVPQLTADECVELCDLCDGSAAGGGAAEAAGQRLLLAAVEVVAAEADALAAAQLVRVVDSLSALPDAVLQRHGATLDHLLLLAAERCETLAPVELAVLFSVLSARAADTAVAGGFEAQRRAVLLAVVRQERGCCARTLALLFSAAAQEQQHPSAGGGSGSMDTLLWLAQVLEGRAVFLAADYTPGELLSVFRAYLRCFVAVGDAVHMRLGGSGSSGGGDGLMEHARQRRDSLSHVLGELSAQLASVAAAGTASLPPPLLLEAVRTYAGAAAELSLTPLGPEGAVPYLLAEVPHTRALGRELSAKLVAASHRLSPAELLALLEAADGLRGRLLDDAVVAAALLALQSSRGPAGELRGEAAADAATRLRALSGLRGEHLGRISRVILPRLQKAI